MASYRRLDVSEVGDVTVVRFRDHRLTDDLNIQESGQELMQLIEVDGRTKLLLDFSAVAFLSSSVLSNLLRLEKRVKAIGGTLKLANIRPDLLDVFVTTRLNRVFDIRKTDTEALAAF
jgi:anti-sigma B factor antagonist